MGQMSADVDDHSADDQDPAVLQERGRTLRRAARSWIARPPRNCVRRRDVAHGRRDGDPHVVGHPHVVHLARHPRTGPSGRGSTAERRATDRLDAPADSGERVGRRVEQRRPRHPPSWCAASIDPPPVRSTVPSASTVAATYMSAGRVNQGEAVGRRVVQLDRVDVAPPRSPRSRSRRSTRTLPSGRSATSGSDSLLDHRAGRRERVGGRVVQLRLAGPQEQDLAVGQESGRVVAAALGERGRRREVAGRDARHGRRRGWEALPAGAVPRAQYGPAWSGSAVEPRAQQARCGTGVGDRRRGGRRRGGGDRRRGAARRSGELAARRGDRRGRGAGGRASRAIALAGRDLVHAPAANAGRRCRRQRATRGSTAAAERRVERLRCRNIFTFPGPEPVRGSPRLSRSELLPRAPAGERVACGGVSAGRRPTRGRLRTLLDARRRPRMQRCGAAEDRSG